MHREFKAVFLFVFISYGLSASSQANSAENPQVTVSVYDYAQLPLDTLTGAEQQATTIFSHVGLDITWLNCSQTNGSRETTACNEMDGPIHLILRITPNVASSSKDIAFGIAFLASDGTGKYGDVFWKRVRDIQANSKIDVTLILGSVMAHEMGHLLLGSNAHAISGIMRAHWEGGELHRISMGTLQFLPEQGRRMHAIVTKQSASLMSSGGRAGDSTANLNGTFPHQQP